jgi:hypothetical protein|tara:strand:+ start:405 stop:548 length:144 start_codon:yes stop_codon:yes gene_type:complete
MEGLEEQVERYKHSYKVYKEAYEIVHDECADIQPKAVLALEALGIKL